MADPPVLAFDVYGTLIDPLAIAGALRPFAGERSGQLAGLWRQKQVEYALRRGLMRAYQDFDACTDQALRYAAAAGGVALEERDRDVLLAAYARLPAYPDAAPALAALRARGHRCVAFTNGVAATVRGLLDAAGLMALLDDIVSVDEVRAFKPDPAVYQHLLRRVGSQPQDVWLVSGNAWDVLGADALGIRTAWVRRAPELPFDPWGAEPTEIVPDLAALPHALAARTLVDGLPSGQRKTS